MKFVSNPSGRRSILPGSVPLSGILTGETMSCLILLPSAGARLPRHTGWLGSFAAVLGSNAVLLGSLATKLISNVTKLGSLIIKLPSKAAKLISKAVCFIENIGKLTSGLSVQPAARRGKNRWHDFCNTIYCGVCDA